jgi:HEAT repeat protein
MRVFGVDQLPRSFDAALRDVEDKKAAVRVSAVRDLARHAATPEGARATTALVTALSADVSAEVRGAAALALADAGARGALAALVDAVQDTHLHVRQMALIALGELGSNEDEAVIAAVRDALADDAPALRFQALIACARLDPPSAEPVLLAATRDADDEVRHVSFRLLEERATTGELAVVPSADVLAVARGALQDGVLAVRLAAAILLGRAGDRSGAPVLAEAAGARSAGLDPEDEQATIVLAGDLELREAIPALERRAFGTLGVGQDPFAYEARIALARLGDARARAAILRGLGAWSRDARTLAVVAAGRARIPEARAAIEAMKGVPSRAEPGAVAEALEALEALEATIP